MAKKPSSKIEDQEILEKSIPLVWNDDESVLPVYANHLYISHQGATEFNITFGQLFPPFTLHLQENELPEAIKIKPVAKIVVSPEAMKRFVETLKKNIEQFESIEAENGS